MKILSSQLPSFDLNNQRAFLRADLNVPVSNGSITNDYRCKAIIPTLDLIKRKGGKIILATHMGRPKGYDASLSTEQLVPWFKKHGYAIRFEPDLVKAIELSHKNNNEILLLENLRFHPEEQAANQQFAQQLRELGDYYVNDAFAVCHRPDTSITLLPQLYASDKRTIGLLIEHELKALSKLINQPQQPFVLIVGGGKVHDKLPVLFNMIDEVNVFLLCPAIVFTFAQAMGKKVGKSLVDASQLEHAKAFLEQTKKLKKEVVIPVDYQVAQGSFNGPLHMISNDQIQNNEIGISIGPKTIELFKHYISQAKTIFFNGLIGDDERPETLEGVKALFNAIANSKAYTVIGGGDSVGIVQAMGLTDKMDYLSTGGGATLTYLAEQPLPGLEWAN